MKKCKTNKNILPSLYKNTQSLFFFFFGLWGITKDLRVNVILVVNPYKSLGVHLNKKLQIHCTLRARGSSISWGDAGLFGVTGPLLETFSDLGVASSPRAADHREGERKKLDKILKASTSDWRNSSLNCDFQNTTTLTQFEFIFLTCH